MVSSWESSVVSATAIERNNVQVADHEQCPHLTHPPETMAPISGYLESAGA